MLQYCNIYYMERAWLKLAERYIADRWNEKVTLSNIASAAGVHPSHLSRSFHQQFGTTIRRFQRDLRIRYAAQELAMSEKSIADVGLEAGFYDQSHFHHAFKKCTGLTPAEFAKLQRARSTHHKDTKTQSGTKKQRFFFVNFVS
jgi:AraC family transcriptional regulator